MKRYRGAVLAVGALLTLSLIVLVAVVPGGSRDTSPARVGPSPYDTLTVTPTTIPGAAVAH